MFTDVSGFTAMSERLDPEEVHALMDRAFEVILAAVHGYEGTINQFLGDGVMALFGAPIAHEDHAGRALRAALAIQEKLAPIRADVQRDARTRLSHADRYQHRPRGGGGHRPRSQDGLHRDRRHREPGVAALERGPARADRGQPAHEGALRGLLRVRGPRRLPGEGKERSPACLRREERARRADPVGGVQGARADAPHRACRRAGAAGRGVPKGRCRSRTRRRPFRRAGCGQVAPAVRILTRLRGCGHLEIETTCASFGRAMAYRPMVELYRRYLNLPEGLSPEDIRRRIAARLVALGIEGEEPALLLQHFLGALGTTRVPPARAGLRAPPPHTRDPGHPHLS